MSEDLPDQHTWNGWPDGRREAFVQLYIGRRGSGKTCLLITSFLPGGVNYRKFHKIYIFSPTVQLDPKWRIIVGEGVSFFDVYSEEALDAILAQQKVERKQRVCIVLDDCGVDHLAKMSKGIGRVSCNGRHLNTTLIYSSQRWSHSSTNLRANADSVVLFSLVSPYELAGVYRWFAGMKTRDEFRDLVDAGTNERYSFIHIRNVGGRLDYYKRFTKIQI